MDQIELATFFLTLPFLAVGVPILMTAALDIGGFLPRPLFALLGLLNISIAIAITIKGGQIYGRVSKELDQTKAASGGPGCKMP